MKNFIYFFLGTALSIVLVFSLGILPSGNMVFVEYPDVEAPKITYFKAEIPVQHYELSDKLLDKFKAKGTISYGVEPSSILVPPPPEPEEKEEPEENEQIEETNNQGTKELNGFDNPIHPLPENSYRISSPFGVRVLEQFHEGEPHFHTGVDMAAPLGTPVYAVLDAKAKVVSEQEQGGKYIILQHGENMNTLFAHLDSFSVSEGDTVEQGEKIGEVGNTGTHSTGPHLHFELIFDDIPLDPIPYLCGYK